MNKLLLTSSLFFLIGNLQGCSDSDDSPEPFIEAVNDNTGGNDNTGDNDNTGGNDNAGGNNNADSDAGSVQGGIKLNDYVARITVQEEENDVKVSALFPKSDQLIAGVNLGPTVTLRYSANNGTPVTMQPEEQGFSLGVAYEGSSSLVDINSVYLIEMFDNEDSIAAFNATMAARINVISPADNASFQFSDNIDFNWTPAATNDNIHIDMLLNCTDAAGAQSTKVYNRQMNDEGMLSINITNDIFANSATEDLPQGCSGTIWVNGVNNGTGGEGFSNSIIQAHSQKVALSVNFTQ